MAAFNHVLPSSITIIDVAPPPKKSYGCRKRTASNAKHKALRDKEEPGGPLHVAYQKKKKGRNASHNANVSNFKLCSAHQY